MPSIDLFRTGFTGVDLKTNPLLLLDKGRVRFAVNMMFEEGTLKSRPGFRFIKVSEPGQFQGGCLFRPSRGLSFQPFSTLPDLFAVVVSGSLVVGCREVAKTEHACRGDVHLAQAENYLLVSNPCGQTYWFDGSVLTPSPGLNEEHFEEIETPTHEMEDETVSAETPCLDTEDTCDGESSVMIRFINHEDESLIGSTRWKIYQGDVRGVSDEEESGLPVLEGVSIGGEGNTVSLEPQIYTIKVSSEGFQEYDNLFAVVEECQTYEVDVRMTPVVSGIYVGNITIGGEPTGGAGWPFDFMGNFDITVSGTDVDITDFLIAGTSADSSTTDTVNGTYSEGTSRVGIVASVGGAPVSIPGVTCTLVTSVGDVEFTFPTEYPVP